MKTNLHAAFKTDPDLEKDGVIVDYGPAKFTISRMGGANSARVKAAHAKHIKPYSGVLKHGSLSDDKLREIDAKVFVETSLISWEGVTKEDGTLIEYSFENAVALMIELPELYLDLATRAISVDTFKADLGNS